MNIGKNSTPSLLVSAETWTKNHKQHKSRNLYTKTSRVHAVLLQGNSTNANIYQSLLPESLPYTWSFNMYHWISQKKIIIIPKPSIFTKTRNQDGFQVCDLGPWNLLTKTNNFVLCAILLLCSVSQLQKTSSLRFKLIGQFFGTVAFISVISFRNKQLWSWHCSSIVLSFWATETIFTKNQTQDSFSGLWPLLL
jgi:hypothetical protein